jgi:hypothetical protein
MKFVALKEYSFSASHPASGTPAMTHLPQRPQTGGPALHIQAYNPYKEDIVHDSLCEPHRQSKSYMVSSFNSSGLLTPGAATASAHDIFCWQAWHPGSPIFKK